MVKFLIFSEAMPPPPAPVPAAAWPTSQDTTTDSSWPQPAQPAPAANYTNPDPGWANFGTPGEQALTGQGLYIIIIFLKISLTNDFVSTLG